MFSLFSKEEKYVFGGYIRDKKTRFESTSGGAFSAIADVFCDENYVIFGAEAEGINVFHSYVKDKKELGKYRKSKYVQSRMENCYGECRTFLTEGKKVLFSGTPCQIAGLKTFLNITETDTSNLLMVEVVCEGVPSSLYIKKYEQYLVKKYGGRIESIDYRYTGKTWFGNGKWDFQVMKTRLSDNKKTIIMDRWFNPFWTVWLSHLMSRPSCYECRFAVQDRVADITLGDLWGVHLYCPELYGKNGGASLIVANTKKGKEVLKQVGRKMCGHELRFEDAVKYQSPMRKCIETNKKRAEFMADLQSEMTYEELNKKWAKRPTIKLLFQKYIYGNRQRIFLWNIMHKGKREKVND